MVLNNPDVLIKMKADIGMKDPPKLAVFNVQDIPLKGEHFLRSGAFILIAYRKTGGGWGGGRQNDLQQHYNSPAPHMCSVRQLDSWRSHAHTCMSTVSRMLSVSMKVRFIVTFLTRGIYRTCKLIYPIHLLLSILFMCRKAISSLHAMNDY